MKPTLLSAAVLALLSVSGLGEEEKVKMNFERADIRAVMEYYGRVLGRKVWLDAAVRGKVYVEIDTTIPNEDTRRGVRTILMIGHGIEIREPNERETFVTWAISPFFKEAIERTKAGGISRWPDAAPAPPPEDSGQKGVRDIK